MAKKLLHEGFERKGGLRSAAQTNKPNIQPPPQSPADKESGGTNIRSREAATSKG
jgi:hypothetical protein